MRPPVLTECQQENPLPYLCSLALIARSVLVELVNWWNDAYYIPTIPVYMYTSILILV